MGLIATIAIASPHIVKTSCTLLNVSLSTSNVPEGATRVQNKSSPYAKTSDVDSNNAGAVSMCRIFTTFRSKKKEVRLDRVV